MNKFEEYAGMSYEQASREAERLIKLRGWFQSWERLDALRYIMVRELARMGIAVNKSP